ILRTAGPEPERPAPRRRFRLTARELEIVGAVLEGGTNRDIAQQFSISEETVKRHLTNIFDKTGVSTRLELALFAIHHQLVPKRDRKSTRLNSSHANISYAVFCLKKKKK